MRPSLLKAAPTQSYVHPKPAPETGREMAATVTDTTQLTLRLAEGDGEARRQLIPLVYNELRVLAATYLRHERPNHTLQPTAVVHEAFLRLVDSDRITWQGRTQFLSLAAHEIRKVLVDHARRRNAAKRGGGRPKTIVDCDQLAAKSGSVDVLALDEAMKALAERSPRQSSVVELRFFGGLNVPEVADLLGVSERTVKEDWRAARAWLKQFMET